MARLPRSIMQQVKTATSDESHHQLITARTIFSAQSTAPPSSPPPTSPLPALPTIAPYKPVRSSSSASPLPRFDRPRRPPRPSASLSDLKPRTIQSPEIARRQRSTELAAQTRISPLPDLQCSKSYPTVTTGTTAQKRASIRLLSPPHDFTSNFSDDVLSALPRVFQCSSPTSSGDLIDLRAVTPTDEANRIRPWQVYHGAVGKESAREKKSRKETRKPVARSPLFMPGKLLPPRRDSLRNHTPEPRLCQTDVARPGDARKSTCTLFSPFHSPKKQKPNIQSSHNILRVQIGGSAVAVNTPFDFSNTASLPSYTSQISSDNLTSLPRLPSTPSLTYIELSSRPANTKNGAEHDESIQHIREKPDSSVGGGAFLSLPYSCTIEQVGLPPRIGEASAYTCITASSVAQFNGPLSSEIAIVHDADALEEEDARPLTEDEQKKRKRKRLLWALSTIALVLIATAGILGGIVWKLNNL